MNVEVQYTADCPNALPVLQRVKAISRGRADVTLTIVFIDATDEVPKGFAGSPTVLIDGENPFGGVPTDAPACAIRPPTPDQVEAAIGSG